MRRRDIVFACVLWGGLLAGLAWALCTQSRWVQESAKPIQATRPPAEESERFQSVQTTATGVMGSVSDDTRTAMAKGLRPASLGLAGAPGQAPAKAGPSAAPPEFQR